MDVDLQDSFTIPVPEAEAWSVLLDLERVASCMPGATLESVDGDAFAGAVHLKIGPIQANYRGSGQFVQRDDTTRRAAIEASGRDPKSAGAAKASVAMALEPADGQTRVLLDMSLSITGKPAQFGKGVIKDVTAQLLQKFATNLAAELARTETTAPAASEPFPQSSRPAETTAATPAGTTPDVSLDVLSLIAGPLLKRARLGVAAVLLIGVGYSAGRRR
jgi:uncharacterized protein